MGRNGCCTDFLGVVSAALTESNSAAVPRQAKFAYGTVSW